MANLIKTRPLAGLTAEHTQPSDKGELSIHELPPRALTNLRLTPKAAKDLKDALGISLPIRPNTTAMAGDLRALWLGPDEWLVQSQSLSGPDLSAKLSNALDGQHHSAKDLSDNYASIRICGTKCRATLVKLTPFDLHETVFSTGQCAQTVMAKSSVILDVVDDGDQGLSLDISLRRSFAAYVWARLVDAGLEFTG